MEPSERDLNAGAPGIFAFLVGLAGGVANAWERLTSIGGALTTCPHARSEPVNYLNDFQLPDSGDPTDVQAGEIPVPAWATSALFFVEYVPGAGANPQNASCDCSVYLGPALGGALVMVGGVGASTIGAEGRAILAADIGGAATIGVECRESGDEAHPGIVTVNVVFH